MTQPPILVVDDEITIASSVAELLHDEGYAVITAANGVEALECVARHSPKLIILDMKMPVMDGRAFAAAYRAQPGPQAPLIVMTAAQDATHSASEIQAQAVLAKPFAIDRLLELVHLYYPSPDRDGDGYIEPRV
jgi:CheY-like chemotaxis protein